MMVFVIINFVISIIIIIIIMIIIIMQRALRSCHAALAEPYQDVGHHFCHGFRQRLLLLADAPALLHACHEEVLQLIGVMHGLAGAHCDGLLQCALQTRHWFLRQ